MENLHSTQLRNARELLNRADYACLSARDVEELKDHIADLEIEVRVEKSIALQTLALNLEAMA